MGSFVRALVDCTAKLGLSPKASTGTEQAFRRPIQRVLRLVACHFVFYHGTHRTHRKGCLAPMCFILPRNTQNTPKRVLGTDVFHFTTEHTEHTETGAWHRCGFPTVESSR